MLFHQIHHMNISIKVDLQNVSSAGGEPSLHFLGEGGRVNPKPLGYGSLA